MLLDKLTSNTEHQEEKVDIDNCGVVLWKIKDPCCRPVIFVIDKNMSYKIDNYLIKDLVTNCGTFSNMSKRARITQHWDEKRKKICGATAFSTPPPPPPTPSSPLPYRPSPFTVSSIVRQFIKDSYSTGNWSRKYGAGVPAYPPPPLLFCPRAIYASVYPPPLPSLFWK